MTPRRRYARGAGMLRRWGIPVVLSIAAHVAAVGGMIACVFLHGLLFSAPVEFEVSSVRLEEIRDLPLGPPPGTSKRAEARPRAMPRRRAPQPRADEGELAAKEPSPIDKPGSPGDEPDAGPAPPPSANGLRGYGPEGSRVMVLLRLDRLRGTTYAPMLDALLAWTADRRDLLEGTGLDLFRDFDALLIATPNPLDETVTFVAGRHRLSDRELHAALEQGAKATGRVLTWQTEEDRPFAERHARPFDPAAPLLPWRAGTAAARDDRLIVLPAPGLVVVTPPIYRPLLLANTTAASTDAGAEGDAEGRSADADADASGASGEQWATLLRRIDAEDGIMPPDAVALLTAVDIFAARSGRQTSDGGQGPQPDQEPRAAPTVLGLPLPRILTASIGIAPAPWVDIRAELETEAQARAWELAWPTLHQRLKTDPFVLMTGLRGPMARAELERNDSQIHLHETVTQGEAMRVLQLTTRLLRTEVVALP